MSLLPVLRGDQTGPARASIVHHSIAGAFAIREGRWKLLLTPDSGGWSAPRPGSPESSSLPLVQLYDLETDPGEGVNLQAQEPERVAHDGAARNAGARGAQYARPATAERR